MTDFVESSKLWEWSAFFVALRIRSSTISLQSLILRYSWFLALNCLQYSLYISHPIVENHLHRTVRNTATP